MRRLMLVAILGCGLVGCGGRGQPTIAAPDPAVESLKKEVAEIREQLATVKTDLVAVRDLHDKHSDALDSLHGRLDEVIGAIDALASRAIPGPASAAVSDPPLGTIPPGEQVIIDRLSKLMSPGEISKMNGLLNKLRADLPEPLSILSLRWAYRGPASEILWPRVRATADVHLSERARKVKEKCPFISSADLLELDASAIDGQQSEMLRLTTYIRKIDNVDAGIPLAQGTLEIIRNNAILKKYFELKQAEKSNSP